MDARSISINFLAFSLICLAGSIVYFTVELGNVSKEIPDILDSIETTADKVEPVVKEVGQFRELIPTITNEVSAIRKQVPSIISEVSEVRKQIPDILKEVKEVRQQIPIIVKEVEKIRPLVPQVLEEVKKTREAIPPMLSKADKIVSKAKDIGKKTSEGAVTGVFTGILKAPFKIVGGFGKAIFGGLTDEIEGVTTKDKMLSENAAKELLSSGEPWQTKTWSNPDSKNSGSVTLKEMTEIDQRSCRTLNFKIKVDNKNRVNRDVTICLNEDSEWEPLIK